VSENVTKLPAQPERLQIAFDVNGTVVDGAVVRPLSFLAFNECITAAQAMTEPKLFDARLRRIRMTRQVTYYNGSTVVPMSTIDILKLPIPAARLIVSHLDDGEGTGGKVVRDGDGISVAIVFELAAPIALGAGKNAIKELEFQAATYGDIEDVLAVDGAIQQTLALISTVAKPLGTSLSLLPSWAVGAITIADGVMISREVLPRFLGSPEE
jgi:hypothetical protein